MRLNFFRQFALPAKNIIAISAVFLLMVTIFLVAIQEYWHKVLDPRLQLAAQTQAEILSQSEASTFLRALTIKNPTNRINAIEDTFEKILLITDPSIKQPFIKGVAIEVDYDLIDAKENSLNLSAGNIDCKTCINTEVAIIDDDYNVLAIAHFSVTDAYYHWLSSDLKTELNVQTDIAILLFIIVWAVVLLLVSRLNKVKRKIEIADHAKTRFIANVSHELRTPLNAILGHTQLFKKDASLMETQGQGVQTIHQSAEHLLALINDILDFSKTDSETIQLHYQQLSFLNFLNSLIEICQIRSQAKMITLQHHFSENLPKVVLADEKRLTQVLLNLLTNAIKFTDDGKVNFTVEALKTTSKNDQEFTLIRFTIKDTGIGIPQSMLDNIFLPYQQVDNAHTTAEGSGLGLAISKQLLDLMDTQLKVESRLGKGSSFSFDINMPSQPAQHNIETAHTSQATNNNPTPTTPSINLANENSSAVNKHTLILPDKSRINELKEHAAKHNILALKQLISDLENQHELEDFTSQIKPLLQKYQFAQLISLLESFEQS